MVQPYQYHPFGNIRNQNVFSEKTLGPSGFMSQSNMQYRFLKSGPTAEVGSGGNYKDPVSRAIFQTWSADWREKMQTYYGELEKTKRQIRFNEYSGSGTSVPRSHGFEFTADYHRLAARDTSQRLLMYLAVAVIGFMIITNM